MTAPRGLHALARLHGAQTAYYDNDGERVGASPEALMAALRAMGVPVERGDDIPAALERRRRELWERAVKPVVVAWLPDPDPFAVRLPEGLMDATLRITVGLEDGGEREEEVPAESLEITASQELRGRSWVELQAPVPSVPVGYHDLFVEVRTAGERTRRYRALLIAAPPRTAGWEVLPGAPDWGVFAPLFALWKSDRPAGIPHFGLLDDLADRVAALGGSVVGTLPLLASFLDDPYDPSPYTPVSKRFWNELFVTGPDGGVAAPQAGDESGLDYRSAARHRRERLGAAARAFFADREPSDPPDDADGIEALQVPPEMAAFVARNPRVRDYARFRALTEALGPWPQWPDRLRGRDVRPDDYDLSDARYHLYAQWRAEQQLTVAEERAAAAGVGLYLDLPLGVHPEGYDVWRDRDQFVLGATAGAPPDPLAPQGQDWGFHPPHPERSRLDGHRYFIETIRQHLRFARVLRIDHVMQLHRLFWVPEGRADDGVYVRYPHDELYAILSIESHRAGSVIVGEDLGTVPRAVRRGMRRHGLPGMYVVQFELREDKKGEDGEGREGAKALVPRRVPEGALASIGTHDTPTFAAWWTGRDAEVRAERGLMEPEEAESAVAGRGDLREQLARGLGVEEDGPAVQEALYRFMGRSEAGLVLANLEDLWMETEPQNVPGTPAQTNWRRRSREPLEATAEAPAARLLRTLNAAREGGR